MKRVGVESLHESEETAQLSRLLNTHPSVLAVKALGPAQKLTQHLPAGCVLLEAAACVEWPYRSFFNIGDRYDLGRKA